MKNHRIKKIISLFLPILASVLLLNSPVHAAKTVTYYHHDALGSPVAMTDENGNLKCNEDYLPYGERVRKEAGCEDNNIWYTGKPEEPELGLQYFGARWYDPSIGRFTGIDPVKFQEGNVHSFNAYAYANNNPYAFIDPDGNSPIAIGLAAIAVIFVAAVGINQSTVFNSVNNGPLSYINPGAGSNDIFESTPSMPSGIIKSTPGIEAADPFDLIIYNNESSVDPANVKKIRDATGKGNDINVKTQKEAEATIGQARPEIGWDFTYQKPKTKRGKEIHPSDGSGQDRPHIKWKDWTQGKSKGAEGHIYFDKP